MTEAKALEGAARGSTEEDRRRVFGVEVSFELAVLAANEEEAEELADEKYANEEWRDGGQSNAECRAWQMRTIPKGWGSSIPHGGDGETSLAQIFARQEASAASARNAPPETSGALSTEGKEKPQSQISGSPGEKERA